MPTVTNSPEQAAYMATTILPVGELTDEQLAERLTRTPAGNLGLEEYPEGSGQYRSRNWEGNPVNSLLDLLYKRSGIVPSHKLRDPSGDGSGLSNYSANSTGICDRLPVPFPPADFTGQLTYVSDWVALIDSCKVPYAKLDANGIPQPQAPPGSVTKAPVIQSAPLAAPNPTTVTPPDQNTPPAINTLTE
jgi:hypothetical protein